MSYYTQDVIAHARQMDLLSYLRMYEPDIANALVNKEIASSDSHQLQNILVKFFC